ncbi:uncharacterized protein LOC62_07G009669 [Vanrija pseudolonga]|uniref:Uncharacterized protein n=1 Tax=Vanrija pseudolonga TaxID=143232 RepID=A0AAF0YK58_9TREE|nr:hypothetical protein LOC62_07G009669 [Vanrija pseudolonga]WOO86182.1 hypothetical protein LOC62_07G009669 [Vanrija pseudolonga]
MLRRTTLDSFRFYSSISSPPEHNPPAHPQHSSRLVCVCAYTQPHSHSLTLVVVDAMSNDTPAPIPVPPPVPPPPEKGRKPLSPLKRVGNRLTKKPPKVPPKPPPKDSADSSPTSPVSESPSTPRSPLLFTPPAHIAEQLAAAQATAAVHVEKIETSMTMVADTLGGYDKLNGMIALYNPSLYVFATQSYLSITPLLNQPAKLMFALVFLTIVAMAVPVLAIPISFVARNLGHYYLLFTARTILRTGLTAAPPYVKGTLVVMVLSAAVHLIPPAVFDLRYHFGALWAFSIPAILFITPTPVSPLAGLIAEYGETHLRAALAKIDLPFKIIADRSTQAIIAAAAIGGLFYIGYLGHIAAYVLTFALLMAQTLQVFGTPEAAVPPEAALEGLHLQLVGCHSLIAMWGWRTITSAIEELEIPPFFSLRGLIVHYVPTYYLWITLLFVAMVATTPEHNETHITTWYAQILTKF